MQKQFVLVLCGGLLGAAMIAWVEPKTAGGATLLVVFALLLVQALAALAGVIVRIRRGRSGPAALALLAVLAAGPARAESAAFVLSNMSGRLIVAADVTASDAAGPRPIILGRHGLAPGAKLRIDVAAPGNCSVLVRVAYRNGGTSEKMANVCERQTLIFDQRDIQRTRGPVPDIRTGGAIASMLPPPPQTAWSGAIVGGLLGPDGPYLAGPGPHRLTPTRQFLRAEDIPPARIGAYGVMALAEQPTDATRARLTMACQAYLAAFPAQETLPASVALSDQMLTIWPLRTAGRPAAERAGCPHLLEHYDLFAGQAAIADARQPGRALDGAGPFLIGWSPSNKRGVPDAIVLVVDMTGFNTPDRFEQAFRFWRTKVIDDPALWRRGFDRERLRLSVRDFVDQYGQAIQAAIKLWGG